MSPREFTFSIEDQNGNGALESAPNRQPGKATLRVFYSGISPARRRRSQDGRPASFLAGGLDVEVVAMEAPEFGAVEQPQLLEIGPIEFERSDIGVVWSHLVSEDVGRVNGSEWSEGFS